MAKTEINTDLDLNGKAIIANVPNNTGSVVTYNGNTKEISTRTDAQIISDLGLITATNIASLYIPKTHPIFLEGTQTNINNWNTAFTNSHTHSNKPFLDLIDQNLDITSSPTFKGIGIAHTTGTLKGFNSENPISFLNGNQTQQIYTKAVLISDNYADAIQLPVDGIYSKGLARLNSGVQTRFSFTTGLSYGLNSTIGLNIETNVQPTLSGIYFRISGSGWYADNVIDFMLQLAGNKTSIFTPYCKARGFFGPIVNIFAYMNSSGNMCLRIVANNQLNSLQVKIMGVPPSGTEGLLYTTTLSETTPTNAVAIDMYKVWTDQNFTQTQITNWNTAFTNSHTHTNKTTFLDPIDQNLSTTSSPTFKGIGIAHTTGTLKGFNSENPISFLNGNQTQQIYTGGILSSNAYADFTKIPTNGIYSKGQILSTGGFKLESGLPAQFLKADGSIDSTAYASSIHSHLTSQITDLASYTGFDVRYYTESEVNSLLSNKDNYGSWNLKTDGYQRTTITSGGNLNLVAGSNTSISYGAGGVVTIASINTDTNTTYSAGTNVTITGLNNDINAIDTITTVKGGTGTAVSGAISLIAGANTTITQSGTNITISSTDTNTTYTLASLGGEPAFSKNTAFNNNYGNVAGTVAQGNDSRILNGQIAFDRGDHATQGYLKSTNLTGYATESWVNGGFMKTSHAANTVTTDLITNWNTAFTNSHTHTNKTTFLDPIDQNLSTTSSPTFGTITTNAFIKSGGTSSQFLKADGSIDSNTYLTSSAVLIETDTLQTITNRGTTTTNIISVLADGQASDPYGKISVTRGITSSFAYYGLTRAGKIGWSLGIDTDSNFIIGRPDVSNKDIITNIPFTLSTVGSVTATSFYESSLRKYKENIKPLKKSGLLLINELEIVTYDRIEGTKNKIGIIADDSPSEFLSEEKNEVDLYKTIFLQAKAIQELTTRLEELEKRLV